MYVNNDDSTNFIITSDHSMSSEKDSSRCCSPLFWSTAHLLHSVSMWQEAGHVIISVQVHYSWHTWHTCGFFCPQSEAQIWSHQERRTKGESAIHTNWPQLKFFIRQVVQLETTWNSRIIHTGVSSGYSFDQSEHLSFCPKKSTNLHNTCQLRPECY